LGGITHFKRGNTGKKRGKRARSRKEKGRETAPHEEACKEKEKETIKSPRIKKKDTGGRRSGHLHIDKRGGEKSYLRFWTRKESELSPLTYKKVRSQIFSMVKREKGALM